MISGRDIVFISSIEWDFLWQVHQELAFQFAAAGNRVLYIENTGIRAPGLQDAGRVVNRLKRWGGSLLSQTVREVLPNIFVVSPLVTAPFGSGAARFVNRHVLLPAILRATRKVKFRDPVLWTFLPTDTALDLIHLLATPKSKVAYYCGADFSLLATNLPAYQRAEAELVRRADVVMVTCSNLFERCRSNSEHVYMVPAVINLDQFNLANGHAADSESSDGFTRASAKWPRPVIGYVGGLHKLVDYRLLVGLAKARPGWSFVLVGARTADVEELATLPNVRLIGQCPHAELSKFIQQFDVCVVPYLNSEITATVVPMKINEYLAMGKPVVSTSLPTVLEFNDRHRVLLTSTNETETYLKAIEDALSLPLDAATVRRRREVAALGDSQAFVTRIGDLLEVGAANKPSNEEILCTA